MAACSAATETLRLACGPEVDQHGFVSRIHGNGPLAPANHPMCGCPRLWPVDPQGTLPAGEAEGEALPLNWVGPSVAPGRLSLEVTAVATQEADAMLIGGVKTGGRAQSLSPAPTPILIVLHNYHGA